MPSTNTYNTIALLEDDALEFLLSRIGTYSSQHNEMVSTEWKKYLRIKHADDFSPERLANLANPSSGLTYGLYGWTTNEEMTLAHQLYQKEPLYQQLLQIQEPDIGNPPKNFALKTQAVSGNFLRQIYFAYQFIRNLKNPPRILLEIGGGYGLLAYLAKMVFPQCKIWIIDIPETILLQYYFLHKVFPHLSLGHLSAPASQEAEIKDGDSCDITFVECNVFDTLNIRPDVVLALACLQEMSTQVVDAYKKWIEDHIVRHGLLYMYNCYGMDPAAYPSPAQIPWDNQWQIIHLQQSTLMAEDYHHLETILQRRDRPDTQWHQKLSFLYQYYEALRAKNHGTMESLSKYILKLTSSPKTRPEIRLKIC